jgi:ubiquinol-cytochrome c reductase cytochrome b subunit
MPIVLLALIVLHLLALHEVGSNNPDGVEIKKHKDENGVPLDGVPFHPFYTVHDLVGIAVFLFVFCFILFFMPEMGGFFLEYANFEEANNLKTPEHIAPVWYFTPFYAVLRAVTFDIGPLDSKFLGLVAMGAAIAILFVLPWLDKSPVKSIRYKGNFSRIALLVFAASFVILGYLGVKAPTPGRTVLAQICTVIYFAYFIGMPFWTRREKTQPEPERVQAKGLPLPLVLSGFLLFVIMVIVPIKAVGAESAFKCGTVECDAMVPDLTDTHSLQRGAKYFVNYCMGCHSAKFSRYERVADDLDIPHDIMLENLVLSDQRIGELMTIGMQSDLASRAFGVNPPDLSLVARSRSPEWLYTYLRNFYADDSRPFGVNNRVFANVGMPHVMVNLQGLLECGPGPKRAPGGAVIRDNLGNPAIDEQCGALHEGQLPGTMTQDEFDRAVYDLVNFLEYLGEPAALKRERMGIFVLLFLSVFFIFAYLLNREYWKGIH